MEEAIEHPKHYNQGNIEVWDFIIDKELGFLEGNVIKYVCRYKHKNGVNDLKKAKEYLEKLISINKSEKFITINREG